MRKSLLPVVALATIGWLLLAGCANSPASAPATNGSVPAAQAAGDGGAPSAAAPAGHGGDACSLVTEAEAANVLATDPGPGTPDGTGGATSCTYGESPSILTVNTFSPGGKAAYDHARGVMTAKGTIDLPGVGDGAFGLFTGPEGAVEFYQGDVLVAIVLIIGKTGAPDKDQLIAMAKLAASRI